MTIAEKLTKIAENEQKIYDYGIGVGYFDGENVGYNRGYGEGDANGYSRGHEDGHTNGYQDGFKEGLDFGIGEGYSEGTQDAYDRFWDAYQDYGKRTDYSYGFYKWWNDSNYNPKYPIVCEGTLYNTYYNTGIADTKVDIDITQATGTSGFFNSCSSLITIHKLKVSENTVLASNTFAWCTALKNIVIEGKIGQNNVDFHWSTKLSADSLGSIIGCLSESATGLTVTLPSTARANYDAVYGEGSWDTLVATKTNWTIAYV